MLNDMKPLMVGVADASRMVGLSRSRLYEMMATKEIETRKVGRRRLVLVRSLERLVDEAA
jgi:predicted transcriptional regulator